MLKLTTGSPSNFISSPPTNGWDMVEVESGDVRLQNWSRTQKRSCRPRSKERRRRQTMTDPISADTTSELASSRPDDDDEEDQQEQVLQPANSNINGWTSVVHDYDDDDKSTSSRNEIMKNKKEKEKKKKLDYDSDEAYWLGLDQHGKEEEDKDQEDWSNISPSLGQCKSVRDYYNYVSNTSSSASPKSKRKRLGNTSTTAPPPSKKAKYPEKSSDFECNICGKSFPTFQALGGHKSSHKNKDRGLAATYNPLPVSSAAANTSIIPTNSSSILVNNYHSCKICNKQFATGRALGGHVRSHCSSMSSKVTVVHDNGGDYDQAPSILISELFAPLMTIGTTSTEEEEVAAYSPGGTSTSTSTLSPIEENTSDIDHVQQATSDHGPSRMLDFDLNELPVMEEDVQVS